MDRCTSSLICFYFGKPRPIFVMSQEKRNRDKRPGNLLHCKQLITCFRLHGAQSYFSLKEEIITMVMQMVKMKKKGSLLHQCARTPIHEIIRCRRHSICPFFLAGELYMLFCIALFRSPHWFSIGLRSGLWLNPGCTNMCAQQLHWIFHGQMGQWFWRFDSPNSGRWASPSGTQKRKKKA